MEVELLDIDQLVKVNKLKPVTNPVSFDKGLYPSKDGLFSEEIFGMTSKERKRTGAYIPLYRKFITPKVYITLKQLNRKFTKVVDGTAKFVIKDGVLEESEEGGTGLKWLYDNWEHIKFAKNDSEKRNRKIDLLDGSKKDDIFIDKFFVVPPFYRDVNLQQVAEGGSPKVPEVTNLYAAIIRNANILKNSDTFVFMDNALSAKTQDLLVEVYNLWKAKIEKKYGYIRKFLLGKSVSWCSRIVITGDNEKAETPEDHRIDFYHTGTPLSHVISMATPFIMYWVRRYFKTRLYDNKDAFPVVDRKTGNTIYVKLENPEVYYNDEFIERQMDRFINSPGSRFDKVEVPIRKSEREKYGITEPIYMTITGYRGKLTTMPKEEDMIERPITWTDIFYLAAKDSTEDKHIVVTRYPVLDYMGSIYTKITILSTRNVEPMVINNVYYSDYPIVDLNIPQEKLDAYFIDSFKLNPLYLPGLVGDHDGDQTTGKILFSKQANEDAERIMHSLTNILGIDGSPIRKFGNELMQALYTLTRFREEGSPAPKKRSSA